MSADRPSEATRLFGALHPEVDIVAEADGAVIGVARFEPLAEHRGRRGWLHGGLAATVLDHVCARVAYSALEIPVVTGRLDLRYREPVLLAGGPYIVSARAERARSRTVRVSGVIRSADDRALVEAHTLFVAVPSV